MLGPTAQATLGVVDPLMPASIYQQGAPHSLKHSHTPIPLQAVTKTGILAVNGPAHKTLWMMNHREFPLNSMSHIERGRETQEGRGLGEEELVLDEVQVPGKEGGKMRK